MSTKPPCRLCGHALEEFVSFGQQPTANAFLEPSDFDSESFCRLAVGICGACAMVQLIDEVPNEQMFHKEYPFRTSGSAGARAHFEQTAQWLLDTKLTDDRSFVIEIGANDGAMLGFVQKAGVRHLGIEPCGDLADICESKGIQVLNAYFDESTARRVAEKHGLADVIFSANTVSHISYLDSVFRGAEALLKPDGLLIFEDPYLVDIVAKTSFDLIYDEHLYFFTAGSVRDAVARYGLTLVDVQRISLHGGEVRYIVAREGAHQPTAALSGLLEAERAARVTERGTLERFAARVSERKTALVGLLQDLAAQGKRVAGYGATAKSTTVLNYCGIGPELVSFICDNTPGKQGRFTPGSHIPVRSPEAFANPYPDYALLFAWNHQEEVMANEKAFADAGGKWILYVPEVTIA